MHHLLCYDADDSVRGRLERQIETLSAATPTLGGDLAAALRAQRDRLAALRRAGADVTPEMIQSFAASLEQLGTRVGEAVHSAAQRA